MSHPPKIIPRTRAGNSTAAGVVLAGYSALIPGARGWRRLLSRILQPAARVQRYRKLHHRSLQRALATSRQTSDASRCLVRNAPCHD